MTTKNFEKEAEKPDKVCAKEGHDWVRVGTSRFISMSWANFECARCGEKMSHPF